MVKLFVGNLADTVDSTKLKQVFQQFTKVTECDVVKNYAFVHIEDDDVQSIINRLNGYTLEGKNIHIQLDGPDAKRSVQMISMVDEEIPRPPEPELQQLYEEYSLSRQRYTYYRERLQKEIHAKRNGMAGSVYVTPIAPLGTASTQLSSAAVPYIAPQPQAYTQPAAIGGSHPYSLKAPYAVATPPQVQQMATVPQMGAVPAQQTTYLPNQTTPVYGTVGATMHQGLVNVQPQQVPYVTAVQQQQSAIGVQSSAPMTTQQYLQSVGLQQAQQQQQTGAQLGLGQVQQTTLNAPYAGVNTGTSWMQQQQPAVQQQMVGQYQRQPTFQQSPQRQSSLVPQQQQSYQAGGLVKLNIM
ncbi:unnamed protein product [Haemonchus placei]|uniref:RRM domain-containing protein n=1 Tax=Haemonchus placei TaxID=6290 RepID=A0A0N4WSK0_HAEPC|nr:unnamed protein product [Haemonchus placei]